MIKIILPINRGFACWPFYVVPKWTEGLRRDAYSKHEATHCRRQFAMTPVVWWIRYALSKKFRWQEERIAYRVEIERLLDLGFHAAEEYFVYQLSMNYWNMVSNKEARDWVYSVFREKRKELEYNG